MLVLVKVFYFYRQDKRVEITWTMDCIDDDAACAASDGGDIDLTVFIDGQSTTPSLNPALKNRIQVFYGRRLHVKGGSHGAARDRGLWMEPGDVVRYSSGVHIPLEEDETLQFVVSMSLMNKCVSIVQCVFSDTRLPSATAESQYTQCVFMLENKGTRPAVIREGELIATACIIPIVRIGKIVHRRTRFSAGSWYPVLASERASCAGKESGTPTAKRARKVGHYDTASDVSG
jgi:dUTPase